MYESLLATLEQVLEQERQKAHEQGVVEGRKYERLETCRELFGGETADQLGRLLPCLTQDQWPTHGEMYAWQGSREEFANRLRYKHQQIHMIPLPLPDID